MSRNICSSCHRHMHLDENGHVGAHLLHQGGATTTCPGSGQAPAPAKAPRLPAPLDEEEPSLFEEAA